MRSISLAAAIFVAAAGLALAQADQTTSNPAPASPPAAEGTTTQPDATAQPPATDQTQNADQRIICHTVASTESRLRRNRQRVCGTRAQWERMQEENARQMQHQGNVQQQKG